jgi:hypothetical protein
MNKNNLFIKMFSIFKFLPVLTLLNITLTINYEISFLNLRKKSQNSVKFSFITIKTSSLEWDLNTKATVIFLGTIILIVVIFVVVYCIYKNRKNNSEVIVMERKVEEKVEKEVEDELKKVKKKKIESIVKKVLVNEEIKENLENDGEKTKDEIPDSSKSFVQKLEEIHLEDNQDNVTVKNLKKDVREVMNEYIVRLPRQSSIESKTPLHKALKMQVHKHITQYDSEKRESPDSSFYEGEEKSRKKSSKSTQKMITKKTTEKNIIRKENSKSQKIDIPAVKNIDKKNEVVKNESLNKSNDNLNPKPGRFFEGVVGEDDAQELNQMIKTSKINGEVLSPNK